MQAKGSVGEIREAVGAQRPFVVEGWLGSSADALFVFISPLVKFGLGCVPIASCLDSLHS